MNQQYGAADGDHDVRLEYLEYEPTELPTKDELREEFVPLCDRKFPNDSVPHEREMGDETSE